jgi:hypothetical protein
MIPPRLGVLLLCFAFQMQRMTAYQRLLASAYAKALNIPLQSSTVSSVTCGGTTVFSGGKMTLPLPQPARHRRRLLGELWPAAAAAANGSNSSSSSSATSQQQQQQQQQPSGFLVMVEVVTRFAIAGPADAAAKDAVESGVLSGTTEALNGPLSSFFGAPAIIRDIQSLGSGVLVGLDPKSSADRGAAAAAEIAAVAAADAATSDSSPAAAAAAGDDDDLVASVELDLPVDLDITLDEEPVAETFIPPSFDFDFGNADDPLTAAFAALDLQLPQLPADQPRAEAEVLGAGTVAQQPTDQGDESVGAGLRLGQDGALMSGDDDNVEAVANFHQQQQQQLQKRQPAAVLTVPSKQVVVDHQEQQQQQQATSDNAAATAAMEVPKGGQRPDYTPYTPLPPGVPVDVASLLGTTNARSRRSAQPVEITTASAPPPPAAPALNPAIPTVQSSSIQTSDVYTPWEGVGDEVAYAKAPPCPFPLTKQHALVDRKGRFIGWNKGAECMFKPNAARQASQQQQQQQPGKAPVSWEEAPACSFAPTKDNVAWDRAERGWGHENGQSCAFRVRHIPYYDVVVTNMMVELVAHASSWCSACFHMPECVRSFRTQSCELQRFVGECGAAQIGSAAFLKQPRSAAAAIHYISMLVLQALLLRMPVGWSTCWCS